MAAVLVCLVLSALARADLLVTHDKKNILSQRIAGKWIQNEALSRELWDKGELTEKEMLVIELTSDEGALQKFPEKVRDSIAKEDSKVYFAGWLAIGAKRYPCLLRQAHGNTCLTFLDDMGLDSINIMMAVGASPDVDQFFVGGRYTSEGTLPFYAYRRKIEESSPPQPIEKPFGISSEDVPARPLPADVLKALRNAPAITLLSLEPIEGERLSGPNTFHGWRVLGKTEIAVADDRKTLATAIETAVNTSKGAGAMCFAPHHGVAIVSAGQTYEFVICFMCGRMHIHTSGQETRYSRVTGKGEVLDKLLSAAKIPLGKSKK